MTTEKNYDDLMRIAKKHEIDFTTYTIDDFRRGLEAEAVGIPYELCANSVKENLDKDPDHYSTFIDKIRRPTILGMAVFDWALTIIGILILSVLVGIEAKFMAPVVIAGGVAIHKMLKVDTQFGYYLGLNPRLR